MDERARIIGAARLQRTLLRLTGVFVVMTTVLVWSLIQSWDWVTFVAIPGTLVSILVVEGANVALQRKMRWHLLMIGLHMLLPLGIGVLGFNMGGIGVAAAFVPLMVVIDCMFVNGRVTRAMKKAGVRVGFLGVREEELRRLRSGVCFHCGYDMAGLPTAVCPECGKESRIGV